ncbi:MAG: SGNH/GDSL hydrolase family protein [bacterium]|nr:SGNH/GDSL hydrolase family protein [bacterium]
MMRFLGFVLVMLCVVPCAMNAVAQEQPKSTAQLAWEQKVGSKAMKSPAFAYVREEPALPRVLLIGDSISIGYTASTRELLKGKANLLRIPTNGGDTSRGLAELDKWIGEAEWDVIHFNWGLHDLKRMRGRKLDSSADRVTALEEYEKNLDALVGKLKATGATLIWTSTTPVPVGAAGRIKGDDVLYNEAAAGVMRKWGVEIDDLYAYVLPELEKHQKPRNVHFTPEGSAFLAKQVALTITRALEGKDVVTGKALGEREGS